MENITTENQAFFAVDPKKDCPHCIPDNILPKEGFQDIHVNNACQDCILIVVMLAKTGFASSQAARL